MASKRLSEYTIELDIKQSDETKRSVDDIERSLKSISESAKDGLVNGLKNASMQADKLAQKIESIAASEKDSTAEIEAYGKAANKTIAQLEKQSAAITYSLSEQGKEQRARLSELQKELSTLGKSKEERERAKNIQKEIKSIQKNIVEGTDSELQTALENNRAIRARLKLSQQNAKIIQAEKRSNKALSSYFKDDLKSIKEKIKAQFEFVKALRTTEGQYKAIKKAASLVGAGIKTAAKGAGALGVGLVGGAIAMGGAAISQAGSMVEREREANRIKAAISQDDKQSLLGEMYIKTGADYTTIVDAINRVTSVLGLNNRDDIAQAAVTEIRYPGAAAVFRQQNTGKVSANDFNIYANRQKAIQSATGASVDQVSASADKIANMRQRYFSNASMTDLQAVYLTLQGSGAYDTQDELDRAFRGFVRAQSQQKENVFEYAQKYFSGKTATRGVYGATNKQQAIQALSQVNWGTVGAAASIESPLMPTTEAEKTAQTMRQFEETRSRLMQNLVKILEPVVTKIADFMDSEDGKKLIDELVSFFTTTIPMITKIISSIADNITQISESSAAGYFTGEAQAKNRKAVVDFFKSLFGDDVSGHAEANGGMVTMPSIAGEAGPEMVVPLDYSRNARGNQLTQNLVQYFNMNGNETTTLSLSQAVKSRDFTRAMASNSYLSGRLGR